MLRVTDGQTDRVGMIYDCENGDVSEQVEVSFNHRHSDTLDRQSPLQLVALHDSKENHDVKHIKMHRHKQRSTFCTKTCTMTTKN